MVRCAGGHRNSEGSRHSEHSEQTSTQPPSDTHRDEWGWKQTIVWGEHTPRRGETASVEGASGRPDARPVLLSGPPGREQVRRLLDSKVHLLQEVLHGRP